MRVRVDKYIYIYICIYMYIYTHTHIKTIDFAFVEFCFQDRVSLCNSSDCLGTCFVDQAGLWPQTH